MTPFHIPYLSGNESKYIQEVIDNGTHFSGDGLFGKRCTEFLENLTKTKALLTPSCTAALEMAALLLDVQPGDEVIMSPFTFSSTANAFELRGAKVVYCDIRPDTLNIDETLIQGLITDRTKVIVPMHYGGVGCNMSMILEIARSNGLFVVEDAAQCINSFQDGKHLGSIGDIGCISFHETKNIHCGEGGAILINNRDLLERAEVIREKGTNRSKFLRGEIPFYKKIDVGSSYLMSEINAAFLWAQLQQLNEATDQRLRVWNNYLEFFTNEFSEMEFSTGCVGHNGHIFWVIDNGLSHEKMHYALGHYQLLSNCDPNSVAYKTKNICRLSLESKNQMLVFEAFMKANTK